MWVHAVLEAVREGKSYKGKHLTIKRRNEEDDTFWVVFDISGHTVKKSVTAEEAYDILIEMKKKHKPRPRRRW